MNVRSLFLIMICLSLSSCFGMGSRSPAPVTVHGLSAGAGSAGVHNVVNGDTLYSISKRYNLPMRDIAVLNNIRAPFKLYEGQRLKLPPPQEYKVQHGDTLYGVSRMFGVSSSEISRMNDLQSPYVLRVGQVLRMPFVTRKTNAAVTVAKASPPAKVRSAQANVVRESAPSVVNDRGVPIPQDKPSITRVTRVTQKAPHRASSKFLQPVRGRVISGYGVKANGLHNDGINIAAARGTSVSAAENGVVVYTGSALKGSGNLVLIRHENQWMTAYGHLDSISVAKGQVVKRGASIGKVGSTGSVSSPQLHFEVRKGTAAVDPVKYLN